MLCSVCGKDHPVEDIEKTYRLPDAIFGLSEEEREKRARISSDFCLLENQVFVRGLIPVPIQGKEDVYCWGVWAEISWSAYKELYRTWDQEDCSGFEDLDGTLANALPVYDGTVGLPVRIVRKPDARPFFFVSVDHPLAHDQRDGISADLPIHYAHL